MDKKIKEAIVSVKKQLTIQKIIDNLKHSHHLPCEEGKQLKRKGKVVLQKLSIGNYCEKQLIEFLEMAKSLQSFDDKHGVVEQQLDKIVSPDDQQESKSLEEEKKLKKVDNIVEGTNDEK